MWGLSIYQIIKGKIKKIILFICYYSGVFDIIRVIFSEEYTPILLYHRILKDNGRDSIFYLWGLGITEREFERQVRYLIRRYKVVNLNEYIQRKNKGERISGMAVITFDDGFRDFGLEILRKYNLTATVFIFTDSFNKVFWRHKLFFILDSTQKKNFTLELPGGIVLKLSTTDTQNKIHTALRLFDLLNYLNPQEVQDALDALSKAVECRDELKPEDVYLTYEEIKGLSLTGIHFGAHSVSHRDLCTLEESEKRNEIASSTSLLMGIVGREDSVFAFPYGRYDEQIVEMLKEERFLCAVTSDEGLNSTKQDNYRLKRIYINRGSMPEFAYKISGAEMLFIRFITFANTLRSSMVSIIKKMDRYSGYKLGRIIRRLTNVNTARYWDNYFSQYDNFWRDFPYRFLREFLPKDTAFSLLDIGCGLGDGCQLLKRCFPLAVIEGADFSPLAIQKAKNKDQDINFFVLDIRRQNPPHKYDFISLVHILEHFDNPYPILDKCLRYVNKAVFLIVPYTEKFESPLLYAFGEHRYLFNEHTFCRYKCSVLEITRYIPSAGYRYIFYKIEP
ncbi:MAG: polysaccharide deacetylase family protein [Candidatus Omnitrophica bacterium]|nr:polysaccharide deacetylase family protein [Candidatus Omnitrophota bacterium]